ncbi:hypothetical protein TNCV_3662161 [Trichonephila clavipes]|nr:hypothetical protein TNCV_3662161 [Trichonephila clavipes]
MLNKSVRSKIDTLRSFSCPDDCDRKGLPFKRIKIWSLDPPVNVLKEAVCSVYILSRASNGNIDANLILLFELGSCASSRELIILGVHPVVVLWKGYPVCAR